MVTSSPFTGSAPGVGETWLEGAGDVLGAPELAPAELVAAELDPFVGSAPLEEVESPSVTAVTSKPAKDDAVREREVMDLCTSDP